MTCGSSCFTEQEQWYDDLIDAAKDALDLAQRIDGHRNSARSARMLSLARQFLAECETYSLMDG